MRTRMHKFSTARAAPKLNFFSRYTHWLHTRWPAGTVEKLPEVGPDGETNVRGARITGDLTGIPLLKFAADSGARAVQAILREPDFANRDKNVAPTNGEILDLAIIGAGVSGISAALEAKKAGLKFKVFEAAQTFSTIVNFPKAKPIYTYPTDMTPAGQMKLSADVKEALLDELETQRTSAGIEPTFARVERIERKSGELLLHVGKDKSPIRARRVIVAIGRSGNYRKLNVPGENLDKVYNRLYDPKEYAGKRALVVGGGDSALETAIALTICGAHVTLSCRNKEFSRPKPENIEKIRMLERDPMARTGVEKPTSERVNTAMDADNAGPHAAGSLRLLMGSHVKEIRENSAVLRDADGKETELKNDVVFVMIGREAPLDFFRRSGIKIRGEWTPKTWFGFILFFTFCIFLFNWKASGAIHPWFQQQNWFPFNIALAAGALKPLSVSLREPGFYYSLAYSLCVVLFGIDRIRRRKTPYVKAQTLTLMAIQVIPLFLLPFFILPYLGHFGWFDAGIGKTVADHLFPLANYGHGREYWRAFGLILAWPLFIWNFFTDQPLWWWLAIGFIQTFVIIPLIIYRWGKGAYCGWICSCGALAETMGDRHRHKMPHGPLWNRLNMTGQVILIAALLLFALRVVSWTWPGGLAHRVYTGLLSNWSVFGVELNYYHVVDIFLAGIVGVGMYFWFSGRVWCRFACPLAALMHIYARFSKFRIFPEKSKCISCNVCTSVCHQGIDIMNFANKGLPMEDPQCVRCSACVQECPTGTLAFGRFDKSGAIVLDKIPASPVRMRESVATAPP
jgi:NosR/NirI family nitrous oxide reductase transcriptional regulator